MDETRIHQTDLFAWSDGRIVLFVDRVETSWYVVRGWLHNDCLADVRRWRFDSDRRTIGQVRRLVAEATGDPTDAATVSDRLALWLVANSRPA